jgi:SHS2 domain-containing protein
MIHIDDILLIGKNRTVIELFKQDLRALFNVMDLDEAADDLVMKIKQNAADESQIWQQFYMCHMPCKAHTHGWI